jgi:nitrogen regulatory protein PII
MKDGLQAPHHVRREVFCSDGQADEIVNALRSAAHTGLIGDGVIMVVDRPRVVRIRTGEEGDQAL